MILLDINDLTDKINNGDIINFKLINVYKNYNTTNIPLLNHQIPLNTQIEKSAKVIKFLGEGSYGKVYKIKIDDQFYALKLNETGCCNNAFGAFTLSNNTTGHRNSAFGK